MISNMVLGSDAVVKLVMLVDELARNIQNGTQTDLILLDFSKAFDKVSHFLNYISLVFEAET